MIIPVAGARAQLVAQHLMTRFGGLADVLSSLLQDAHAPCDKGMEPPTYLANLASALVALAGQQAAPPLIGADLHDFITAQLNNRSDEALLALFLDDKTFCLDAQIVAIGSRQQISLQMRHLLRLTLMSGADAVILAHNHPNGNAEPSVQDFQSTAIIEKALDVIGVKLVDHFIVSDGRLFSIRYAALLDG